MICLVPALIARLKPHGRSGLFLIDTRLTFLNGDCSYIMIRTRKKSHLIVIYSQVALLHRAASI